MKKLLTTPVLLLIIFFSSCKKENVTPDGTPVANPETIRYEFSSDNAANYRFSVLSDDGAFDETAYTANWSKEFPIAASDAAGARTAQIMVFPPDEWRFTANISHITIKIFVRGVEKASKTMDLFWLDRPTLFRLSVTY